MGEFDDRKLVAVARNLEAALRASDRKGTVTFRAQLQPLFDRIAEGDVSTPLRRAPGGRAFMESELPNDARIARLYHQFCDALEGG